MKTLAAKEANQRYALKNKDKLKARNLQHRIANPEKCLARAARQRALRLGVPYEITHENIFIPEYCPILGIKLERKYGTYGGQDSSPSLDRRIPALGYVPGNIWVISQKANAMKSNATVTELQSFAKWISTLINE